MRNQFEFLGNTSLGQYIPGRSWFQRRDPRAKLLVFLSLFFGIVFSNNIFGVMTGVIVIFSLYLMSRFPIKSAWRTILRASPFLLLLCILQILLASGTETSVVLFRVFGLEIYQTSVMGAVLLLLRFIALICLLNLAVMSISTSQISAAIFHLFKPFERIGFPVNDLTMVLQITLRYIPLVAQIAEKIAKAQAARGGDWERRGFNPIKQAKMVLPLIVPVIIMSLKRAETMAVAMESRGFNAAERRSSFYEFTFSWQDASLIGVSLLFSTLMILSGRLINL